MLQLMNKAGESINLSRAMVIHSDKDFAMILISSVDTTIYRFLDNKNLSISYGEYNENIIDTTSQEIVESVINGGGSMALNDDQIIVVFKIKNK